MQPEAAEQTSDPNRAVADAQQPMAELVGRPFAARMLEAARRPGNR